MNIINNSDKMNRGLSINTLKMLSSKNSIETLKRADVIVEDNATNQNIQNIQNIHNTLKNSIDIDYNFCAIYYETQNNDLINKLVEQSGIKNMINLNSKFDQSFNWKNYSKFCPELNNNEILVKKNFLEKLNQKMCNAQLLNIIIIKTTNKSLDTIFSEFNNINVQFSVISEKRDDVEHYNIKNYNCTKHNQLNVLNNILKENTAKYFMIIYDYHIFEYNFVAKIIKDLNNLINLNALLLIENSSNTDHQDINQIQNQQSQKTEYFRIKTDFLRKITDSYICIINNDIKQEFDYSMSEMGIILYINQVINKYNSVLSTTDYLFKNNNDANNKLTIKDMVMLFDLYISNIENDVINDYLNSQTQQINDLELFDSDNNIIYANKQIDKQINKETNDLLDLI